MRYEELLGGATSGIKLPFEPSWARGVYHLYVVGVENRDQLQKHLGTANIGTGIHYPIPVHLQQAYRDPRFNEGDFPIAERVAREVLSLPMFPEMRRSQIEIVCDAVRAQAASTTSAPTGQPAGPEPRPLDVRDSRQTDVYSTIPSPI